MKLNKITLVTSNKAKANEIQRIIDIPIEVKNIELDEIQELDLHKVTLHKLNQAYDQVKTPVIVDDVSVEIEAWNGFPGPLVKWMLMIEDNGAAGVLRLMKDENNRNATAKLGIGFHDGNKPYVFIGECNGKIATEIGGINGFGWDPVFIPDGYKTSFAQMDPKEKDKVSHRGNALKKFTDFIKENYDI